MVIVVYIEVVMTILIKITDNNNSSDFGYFFSVDDDLYACTKVEKPN